MSDSVSMGKCSGGKARSGAAALAAALLWAGGSAMAGADAGQRLPDMGIPWASPVTDHPSDAAAKPPAEKWPIYLDEAAPAPAAEQPNIHGFFNSPFRTAYVTPRGLVVQNAGVVWQPIVGLVFPIGDLGPVKGFTVVAGIWNSVNSAESNSNPFTAEWDEMDVFVSLSGNVAKYVSLNLTYSPWNSPGHAFRTEHNMDLKVGFDDSKIWGDSGFALNPYLDIWWAMSGDSTVILGRKGSTGYLEPGIVPTFSLKGIPDYPITLTFPMYFSVGPASYWDAKHTLTTSNFGLISAGANISVPLSFIPARYGHWHADAGVTYDYLINDSLLQAGKLASGNTSRNVVIGSVGFGVNF